MIDALPAVAPTVPCPGRWNAYVAAGADRAERQLRLAQCPSALREGVISHLRTIAAIARRRADPQWQAWAAAVRAEQAAARAAAGQPKPSDPEYPSHD